MSTEEVKNQFGLLLKLLVFVEAVGVEDSRQLVIKAKRTCAERGVNGLNELRKQLGTPENMNNIQFLLPPSGYYSEREIA
jgi:hypothetical protein